jgi:DNA-directed RNA polymerase specialized sigma24 family protein
VISLRAFLDLDTQATAEVLGIAPGTVTAHLSRAVTALRLEPAVRDGLTLASSPDNHDGGQQ